MYILLGSSNLERSFKHKSDKLMGLESIETNILLLNFPNINKLVITLVRSGRAVILHNVYMIILGSQTFTPNSVSILYSAIIVTNPKN